VVLNPTRKLATLVRASVALNRKTNNFNQPSEMKQ
jgi:hypothetical protein